MDAVKAEDSTRTEQARLAALERYSIMDSEPEVSFDRIAQLAKLALGTPVALVTFIDETRQWFKAKEGIGFQGTPREIALCNYTIRSDDLLIVPDTQSDRRFQSNPLVTGDPRVRFYGAAPLITPDGFRLGSVCALDFKPRKDLSVLTCSILKELAALVGELLELRYQAAQARAEKQQLSSMLSSTTDLIYTKDVSGRYTYLNRDAFGDEGLKVADVIGKTDDELFPESSAELRNIDCHVMQTREAVQKEEALWYDDQRFVNFSKKTPLINEAGEVKGILGISRDVTQEVETRQELERSLSLLKAAFEATQEGLLSVNLDKKIEHYNQRYLDMRGVPAKVLQAGDAALIAYIKAQHKQPEAFEAQTAAIYAHPEHSSKDIVELKDGRIFERSSEPQRVGNDIIGRVWSFRDITEEKRAQAAREQSEAKLRAIIEASSDAIFTKNCQGQYTLMNKAGAALFNKTPEEIIGQTDETLFGKQSLSKVMRNDQIVLTTGKTLRTQEELVINQETHISIVEKAPLSDETGDITGLIGICRDITKERRAREALRRAKDEAEAANRAKSEFLSRMSHELRTPLNAILGFGQLLEYSDLDEGDQDAVHDILKAGKHLLGLIDDVLDIARIESGHLALSLEPVPVHDIIAEAVEMVSPLAKARKLTLERTEQDNLHIFADQQRLKQVLLNFLSNAVKYNREGGSISLSCEPRGEHLRLSVRDTGQGIAEALLPRVFEPFDRLGAETTTIEGAGIGLALCKHLIELMGGHIGVESVAGQGSTFWLELQRASNPNVRLELPTSAAPSGLHEQDFTIVYIEDNLSNLKLVERIFARTGKIKLLSTMQGRIGIDLVLEHKPAIILLDLHLPDLSGEEVLSAIRAEPETAAIPVVVVSADAMPKTIQKLDALGADAYLTKPLDLEAFNKTIEGLLEQA